ncbi:MAG: NAD-dependent deacetylase [Actinobacteria bacterium]|nr:NAD-dependent deacetylase [Actinomycetota bacterium]
MESESNIALAQSFLEEASSVVVLSGAGISTGSGIPDFRGPEGVWTQNPEAEMMSRFEIYVSNAEVRAKAWQHRAHSSIWEAEPNAAHRALLALEASGRLSLLVTQNIDGLHHRAGSSPEKIVEIHGNVRDVLCLACNDRTPMDLAVERVLAGEIDPRCSASLAGAVCGGILKSSTISFGQSLVASDLERSFAAAESCDLFLALGTSLGVYPVAELPLIAERSGAKLIIMNAEPTAMDAIAQIVIHDDLSLSLPALLDGLSKREA